MREHAARIAPYCTLAISIEGDSAVPIFSGIRNRSALCISLNEVNGLLFEMNCVLARILLGTAVCCNMLKLKGYNNINIECRCKIRPPAWIQYINSLMLQREMECWMSEVKRSNQH